MAYRKGDFLSPGRAAAIADTSERTIVIWCTRIPGLGRKVAGRWRVDPITLQRILEGVPGAPAPERTEAEPATAD